MKAFKCEKCGKVSYSAADIEHQTNPNCIYCGAGKQFISEVEDIESKSRKTPKHQNCEHVYYGDRTGDIYYKVCAKCRQKIKNAR